MAEAPPFDHVGQWRAVRDESTDVHLRSARLGAVSVEAWAPIVSATCGVDAQLVHLYLSVALNRLRTRSFVIQTAARALIAQHGAARLTYHGSGAAAAPWRVDGTAVAGSVEIPLTLAVHRVSEGPGFMVKLTGTAHLGTVHLPLPGLGTVEDFVCDVDARLPLHAQ